MAESDSIETDLLNSNSTGETEENEKSDDESDDGNFECTCCDYNEQLQSRILSLRQTIRTLKGQLNEEREIWKREIEERRESDYITRATQYGLDYYKEVDSNDLNNYQNQVLQAHFEKRQLLEKQIAMSNYKRRLLEVENMCNLELLRVKQSVQILQPLQMMCSEWKFSEESGDFIRNQDAIKEENTAESAECNKEKESESTQPCEVKMPLEMLAQKFEKNEKEGPNNENVQKTSKSQPSLANYVTA